MVGGPGKLSIAGVAGPQVQHTVDHQQAAGLLASGPVAFLFQRRRAEVLADRLRRICPAPGDSPRLSFSFSMRLEAVAVAVGRVQIIVVAPGDRPIVAPLGPAEDRVSRGPADLA